MPRFEKYAFVRPSFLEGRSFKRIGFIRSAIASSDIDAETQQLIKAGCFKVFTEVLSRPKELRKDNASGFYHACSSMAKGDQLIVLSLDRLGGDMSEVIFRMYELQQRGLNVKTLDGFVDTTTLADSSFPIMSLLLALYKANGVLGKGIPTQKTVSSKDLALNLGGRPKTNKMKENLVIRLRSEGFSYRSIKQQTGLALSTIRRIIVDSESIYP